MTSMVWALLAVAVVAIIGILVFVMVRNGRQAPAEYDRTAPQPCIANGHTYRIEGTAWRCAVCGNHVPRKDGEQYGPSDEGRVERRREER